MLIVASGSSSSNWHRLANNADELRAENLTNWPARLWVETYGARPRNSGQLVRLGRRYLADQVAEGHALGLQVGAWLARGTGPAAMADACERLQVRAGHPPRQAGPPVTARSRPGPHPGRL